MHPEHLSRNRRAMQFYLYEKLEKIRKQLRPKTCWDIRYVLALYVLICVRYVVYVVGRRYAPWMARYDVLTVSSNFLRVNFPEEVCFFGLLICCFVLDLLVELTDPKLTFWSFMHCIHSQHVDNYRATKVDTAQFSDAKFQSLLRNQQLLEPPNCILRWAHRCLPELFDHRRLTVAAHRHQSPVLRLSTFQHRYHNIVVVHVAELIYNIFVKFFYVILVLFLWIVTTLQLRLFPPVFLPLLLVENYLMVVCIVLRLIHKSVAINVFGFLSFIQLRVYFHHLWHLMVKQMQQATLSVAFPRVFRLFQIEHNRSVWLLMQLDQELFRKIVFALMSVTYPILIVHANLIFLEPTMNMYVKTYMVIQSIAQLLASTACMVDTIRTSEAAYTITNLLPTLQLRLRPQSGQLRLKLKVMRYFEAMNCPMSKRVTISIGSIDKITRYFMMQFAISLVNVFLMIARLLMEEKQNWIYE